MMTYSIIKILIPAALSFVVGIASAPLLTYYLCRYKAWKKLPDKVALDGAPASEFAHIRSTVHGGTETSTPRMGGVLIWMTVALVSLSLWLVARLTDLSFFDRLDFVSRSQTWIPLLTLIAGGFMGLANDLFDIQPGGERGIRLRYRLFFVTVVALGIGLWFYNKLGVVGIALPGGAVWLLGPWIILLFVLTSLALYAGGVIDGVDGLSGGVFGSIFMAYSGIAYFQNQINLAALCAAISGATLAFLWFNVPPARFWMTETGTMGLTMTLAVVAFLTDTPGGGYGFIALPIIAFPLVVTVASNVIQVYAKAVLKRKVFRIAPLHHHFEAIGWPPYKVTMRYWIISLMCAIVGMTVALLK
jgi:phospho-N-acetylmuramoyl-pentapeptide-transferase